MFYGALHQGAMQNEAYAASFKNMTAKFSEAMQPLVDVFAAIMIHVFNFIAFVSELIIKFNEAHPILSKIIAGFLLLIPALTLLLAPLAVGISMFGSFAAAFNATWMLIGPLVTGLAAISGPVLLIAAAIALLGAGLVLLWNKTTWFKDAVLGAWEAIKDGIMIAWDATVKFLTPAVKAVVDFFVQQWDGIVKFWGEIWPSMKKIIDVEFGAIIVIVTTVGGAIVKYMQWAWPYISDIIKNVWNVIKSIVSGVLNILKGIIKTFIGVISGDWKLAWEGIKQVIGGAWEIIKGTIKGAIGIIQTVLKAAGDGWTKILGAAWEGIKKGADSAWTGIKSVVLNVWDGIVTGVKGYINMIIRAMNFMINGLNKVSFSVPDWVPQIGGKKFGFSIGTIPALAEGGITTGPTLAMIGEGKEQEAVLPLSKLQALLDGNGGGGITIEKMEVRSDNDIVRIAQELYRLQNRRGRSAGVIMP
jgi:phage-related protein